MADLKKFLDQSGVSTLWGQVAANLKAEADRAKLAEEANAAAAKKAQDEVDALEILVGSLPAETDAKTVVEYINKKTEGIATDAALSELQKTVDAQGDAIELLNGDAETVGSVANTATTIAAAKVAEIVANADADFDTLKEIADWILNDTTGAADMANDIAALQAQMVGVDETVVKSIASAIDAALKVEGVEKYALATELSALALRVKALEDADLDNRVKALEAMLGEGEGTVEDMIADAKQAAIDAAAADATSKANAAEANAKAYADGLAGNYDAKGSAAQALVDAKAYSDANLATAKAYSDANLVTAKGYSDDNLATAKAYTDEAYNAIIALTADEILAAINGTV